MADIERVVAENQDSVVLIDEAYVDFGGRTALPLLKKYPNVVIVRTMSKSRALAGMRVGYAFGSKELIKALHDVKFSVNSYTLNMPALAAGVAAASDREYFEETVDRVLVTREKTKEALRSFGFTVPESRTNFLFAKPPEGTSAEVLFEKLKEKDIYVRFFNKPRLSDYLRITVGTDAEMEQFIKVLQDIL
jgi:histidinol-phosphate aminotransferase